MITVTNDRILAKKLISENKSGRFVLVGDDAVTNEEAEVLQVGEGVRTKTGVLIPPSVKPGDRILLMPGSSTAIKVNGEEMIVIKEDDIIAIMGDAND
jgi:chaperonin GroES